MSVSESFVPNVVIQHVNCFAVSCVETAHYKRKRSILLIGDVVYDARFSVCFEVQSQDIISFSVSAVF